MNCHVYEPCFYYEKLYQEGANKGKLRHLELFFERGYYKSECSCD